MKILNQISLIAVLRGITPPEVQPVAEILYDAGWQAIEITLNSPNAYESLKILHTHFKNKCLIGAGTVLSIDDVQKISDIGLDFIISPNINKAVIKETKHLNLLSIPGVFTPSEAFDALEAGADALKFFPGESINPSFIKAIRAVLPQQTILFVTGGIDTQNMQSFLNAGVNGFGIGGSVYKPNLDLGIIEKNARTIKQAFDLK